MISVVDAFSVEEVDSTRVIAQSTQVSWKKNFLSSIHLFTIGSSIIGGTDTIAGPAGVNSNWNKYQYVDESGYVMSLGWERELNLPEGGMVKAQADVRLSNTSGRFTPRQLGGSSDIYTAIQPQRPVIINAGFNYGGIDNMIPQFVGITDKQLALNVRNKTADLHAFDFLSYLENTPVDHTAMYTSVRTDVLIASALSQLGYSTAQYDLDPGINIVGFALFNQGDKWGNYIDQLVKAENGHLWQDEEGVIRFDNRQKWSQFPYFNVQRVITTAMVLDQQVLDDSHIVNVVEVSGSPRAKDVNQLVWEVSGYTGGTTTITLPAGANTEVWASYNDPMLSIDTPAPNSASLAQTSFYIANTASDASGTDMTSSVSLKAIDNFAQASKMTFINSSSQTLYLTTLDIWGRPARKTGDVYYRGKADASLTAYQEQVLQIDNDYIQDPTWAQSLAEMILNDFSNRDRRSNNLQQLSIRAIPELQLGDLISWQGHYWRVYGIKSQLDPAVGFVQDLKLIQKPLYTYFRVGYSLIGGSDMISP